MTDGEALGLLLEACALCRTRGYASAETELNKLCANLAASGAVVPDDD